MATTTPTSKAKRGLLVGILSVALLFLSGCFRMDMNFEFFEDNTANMTMELTDTSGFLLGPGALEGGGTCDDLGLEEMSDNAPEGAESKVEEFTSDDGSKGCRLSMLNIPIEEVSSDVTEGLNIQRAGDEFVINIPADEGQVEDISQIPGAEMNVSFTFPGEVTDAGTGTLSEDGRTVVFSGTSAFTDGVDIKGKAVDNSNDAVITMLLILGAVIIAGIVGGILVVFARKNKSGNQEGQQGAYDVNNQQQYNYAGVNNYGQQAQQQYDPSNPYAGYANQPQYGGSPQPPHQQNYPHQPGQGFATAPGYGAAPQGQYPQQSQGQYPPQAGYEQPPTYGEDEGNNPEPGRNRDEYGN